SISALWSRHFRSTTPSPGSTSTRRTSVPQPELPQPTTTAPSPDTPVAELAKYPPARSPRASMPPPEVQRNASPFTPKYVTLPEELEPTTTEPSPETPVALLRKVPPARPPRPTIPPAGGPAERLAEAKLARAHHDRAVVGNARGRARDAGPQAAETDDASARGPAERHGLPNVNAPRLADEDRVVSYDDRPVAGDSGGVAVAP